jgi:putative ABC transport system permease protein
LTVAAPPSPPSLASALLHRLLSAEDAEVITGDLEEIFVTIVSQRGRGAARRWYRQQVFSIIFAKAITATSTAVDQQQKGRAMAAFHQDLWYSLRSLAKQPGFMALAVIMLALGIGANVAIFSLVDTVLLKPLPFADPDRLMIVHLLAPDRDAPDTLRQIVWSYPKYVVLRDNQRAFESTAAFASWNWNLTGSGSPERITGELVEASYFDVLGVGTYLGRTFSAEETSAPGSVPLVMLSHGFWVSRFGGDRNIVGRTVGLNGTPHTIVGVLSDGFRGLTGQADMFVPVTTLSAADLGEKWNHTFTVVARRKGSVSAGQAIAAAGMLGDLVNAEIPDGGPGGGTWSATAVQLNDERVDPLIRRSILLLTGAVVSVLLIVCINLANLMVVRGIARQREVAIRLALGASRLRVVRQFMAESVILAVIGAVLGLLVAYLAVSGGAALLPDLRIVLSPRGQAGGLTRIGLARLGLDTTTLLFTFLLAGATALLFGLVPAWHTSRRDLTATIKAGSSGAVSQGTSRLTGRNLLIVGEMALALMLLTAGGLMVKSVARLQATELGFTAPALLSTRVVFPAPQYNNQRATQQIEQLLDRLATHPEIASIGYGSCAPLQGGCNGTTATFPGRPPAPKGRNPAVGVMWASPKYFDTLGIRLLRGRMFTDRDRVGQPKVVVINETAARTFWGNEDPLGKRVGVGQGGFGDGAEVVGVVADVRYGTVEKSVGADVYLPLLQSLRTWGVIFVRSRASTASIVSTLKREVQALDPDLPLTDIKLMAERFDDATWRTRMSAWLLGIFATLALSLAALGLYGVMSQGVQQRTREIGVRMALGADRSNILRLIVTRVCVISLAGIVLGLALAVPAMRLLTSLLFEVSPGDPAVFGGLALVLLSVALVAGYVPARRATRVDPLTTLRAE